MSNKLEISWLALMLAAMFCLDASATTNAAAQARSPGSFKTRFALVEMHDVPVGKTTAPCLPDGSYYTLRNDTEIPLKVFIKCQLPGYCEPARGTNFVALPDRKWVKFDPPVLELPPHSDGESLITVTIPDKPEYYGKHYEFWVHADAIAGQAAAALVSRVRLNTIEAGATDTRVPEEPRKPEIRPIDPPKRSFWRRLLFWR